MDQRVHDLLLVQLVLLDLGGLCLLFRLLGHLVLLVQ